MLLNKSERHTAYIIMLAEAERGLRKWQDCGFCWMIFMLFGIDDKGFVLHYDGQPCRIDNVIAFFPELIKKKPSSNCIYWFDKNKNGWQKRIELLKQCIIETY